LTVGIVSRSGRSRKWSSTEVGGGEGGVIGGEAGALELERERAAELGVQGIERRGLGRGERERSWRGGQRREPEETRGWQYARGKA
jgi:hypothetical protein